MIRILFSLFLTLFLLAFPSEAASARALPQVSAQSAPIVTFRSTAMQEVGEGNSFSIFLGTIQESTYTIDMGTGSNVTVDVQPGIINTTTGEWEGTYVSCSATQEGVIKIYGDASNLNILCIDGGYVQSIEMDACANLEVLSLQHNVLENLDLTPFHNLYAVYLTDNPFTGANSLVIGPDKPSLAILEIDIISKMAPGFSLADYPAMQVFDAYYNRSIKSIDTSKCPNLLSLSVEMTDVESLDLSKNPLLRTLNIAESRITSIDLSGLPDLVMFNGGHLSAWVNAGYKLSNIDVTKNTKLFYLNLSGNALSQVDLSKNPLLSNLQLSHNSLSAIDLSANPELYSVSLSFNNMDYATLPEPEPTWGEYFYRQNAMPLPRAIAKSAEVDMSARVLREGTTTDASAWASPIGEEDYELSSAFYTYADGKFTFKKIPSDSVYVKFTNDVFNEYALTTTKFKVKNADEIGKPSKILTCYMDPSIEGNIQMAVGMSGAAPTSPKKFFVEWTSGNLSEYTTTFSDDPTACNINIPAPEGFNGYFYIWIPEEEVMTSLSMDGIALYSINLTDATELRYLSLNGCGLNAVDLKTNRCLEYIDVSNNLLTALDLEGLYGNYAKNKLFTVKAANNHIAKGENFKYNDCGTFHYLDLSNNEMEDFSLLEFENLQYVDLSHNKLSEEFYLTYQISASHIDLSHNNLPSVVIDYFDDLQYLDISSNDFTLASVPLPAEVNAKEYIYAPQQDYQLSQKAPAVNLSSQNRLVDGVGTTFKWFKANGTALKEGTDYTCVNGSTSFLKYDLGEVYCVMSNPAFPDFTGQNKYRTTNITPVEAPSMVVASFTTTTTDNTGMVTFAASRKTELYIDWKGDGAEYQAYPVETSYIAYGDQQTYANAEVKVYTYESADLITVFSITDIPMSKGDFSALTQATCINLGGSKIGNDNVKLPLNAPLTQLTLSNCNLTSFPWASNYPNLDYLVLANNDLTEFDASALPNLGNLFLTANNISKVTINNPRLWSLDLADNQLESVSLKGLPEIYQLSLANNRLTSIDLSPVKDVLKVLSLQSNYFNFSTLPVPADYPNLNVYYYGNQAPLEVKCENGQIDLSSQAEVAGIESAFAWYVGIPEYDSDQGCWVGDQLVEGEDYTIEDGVTSFSHTIDSDVMCLITNEVFPNLLMYTYPTVIDSAGLDGVIIGQDSNGVVNVYNINGMLIKRNASTSEALEGLAPGLYVVGNRKMQVK